MKSSLILLVCFFSISSYSQVSELNTDTIYLKNGDKYIGYLVAEEVKTYEFKLPNAKKLTSIPKDDVLKIGRNEKSANSIVPTKSSNQSLFPVNSLGEIEYTEVVKVDSAPADVLYSRAKMSIAQSFKSAKNVIQNDDQVNKQILLKGNISADYSWNPLAVCPAHIDFTMTVFCKDNRYKFSIKPSEHIFGVGCKISGSGGGNLLNEKPDCGTFNMPKSYWNEIKSNANAEFLMFIESFKKKMLTSTDNDW